MQKFLREIILEAGKLSLEYRKKITELKVDRKSAKDLVSEADVAIERMLTSRILDAYPDHSIHGEEGGKQGESDLCWVIDPIDGTTSFVHQLPFYCISIAFQKNGETVNAGVYAPVLDELFEAQKGKGAFLNGNPIHVSQREDLVDCVLATGFACLRSDMERNNLPYFNEIMPKIRDIRRSGSAAMDLCYVACGRIDGFWELNLNIYDVAAGVLLVQEAGGIYTDFRKENDAIYGENLATNGKIHDSLSEILSK